MSREKEIFRESRLHALSDADGVVTITLSNPEVRNALDLTMSKEAVKLRTVLRQEKARVLIFRGEGDVFSAGGDLNFLRELTQRSRESVAAEMRLFYSSFLDLARFPAPTIAFLNGHAVGAGFCFALACDMIYAVPGAKLGLNFVKLGLAPGMAAEYVTRRLPRGLAFQILTEGDLYKAQDLAHWSIFNAVAPAAELEEKIRVSAAAIAANSARAIRFTLRHLRDESLNLPELLFRQGEAQADCLAEGEVNAAIDAVLGKKPMKFRD